MVTAKTQMHTPPGWRVSEMGQLGAEGFVKDLGERGRKIVMINGEIMACLFTE